MSDARVPVSLSRRHREALERVAATFRCPQERLIDEAVEHYLRRLGEALPPPAPAGEPEPGRRSDAEWTSVLR
ncbi:MAG: hypothetical protein KatS3mg117_2829 [Geminicoccaceae bacterium]|jgi:hypothetical protein|nr:MAG: hypothetical protein KatS3mg117_2829 [Geminicoccaceae bacterium]